MREATRRAISLANIWSTVETYLQNYQVSNTACREAVTDAVGCACLIFIILLPSRTRRR